MIIQLQKHKRQQYNITTFQYIHLIDIYLSHTYYMPGSVLSTEDSVECKIRNSLPSWCLYINDQGMAFGPLPELVSLTLSKEWTF